jgi:3-(3-hydroxy-phenyl)propionate hydroxylase
VLETYTSERRGAVTATINELTKTTLYMNSTSSGARLMRDAVLSLSLRNAFARKLFEPFAIGEFPYHDSVLNGAKHREAEFAGGPPAGAALTDFPIESAGGDRHALYDRLGRSFSGIYIPADKSIPGNVRELFARLGADSPCFKPIVLGDEGMEGGSYELLIDPQAEGRRILSAQPGSFYLVRPDHVVAARWRQTAPEEVLRALRTAAGRPA